MTPEFNVGPEYRHAAGAVMRDLMRHAAQQHPWWWKLDKVIGKDFRKWQNEMFKDIEVFNLYLAVSRNGKGV